MKKIIKKTERGWAGHFICSHDCLFRRNTLLECDDIKIVVSTVGAMITREKFETIGYQRYYETMAFHSDPNDARYHDISVTHQVDFSSNWAIGHLDADDKANDMHEAVVWELEAKLKRGEISKPDLLNSEQEDERSVATKMPKEQNDGKQLPFGANQ